MWYIKTQVCYYPCLKGLFCKLIRAFVLLKNWKLLAWKSYNSKLKQIYFYNLVKKCVLKLMRWPWGIEWKISSISVARLGIKPRYGDWKFWGLPQKYESMSIFIFSTDFNQNIRLMKIGLLHIITFIKKHYSTHANQS